MSRIAIVLVLSLFLLSCAAGQKMTGYSATSGNLRNEVLTRISQIEQSQNNCANVSAIVADDPALPQFMKAPNARVFNTGPSNEVWVATACGAQHRYSVQLLGDHGVMQLQNVQPIAP